MPSTEDLIVLRPEGLYVPAADVYLDPWRPVSRSIVTHGHADHARPVADQVLASAPSLPILQRRIGSRSRLEGLAWGERLQIGEATLSLHPASHILGAAQVRVEVGGRVWAFTGDYRVASDPSCDAFEPVSCEVLISECTFGLPVYRWRPQQEVILEMVEWWRARASEGRVCVLYTYALGKAQRVLTGLREAGALGTAGVGPLLVHNAVLEMNTAYHEAGRALPDCQPLTAEPPPPGALVLAPQAVQGSRWMARLKPEPAEGVVSGWMAIRGVRRRQPGVRGFVLSDHADWPGLLEAIAASGAERVLLTHGQTSVLARWLSEQGLSASALRTDYQSSGLTDD